MFGKFFSKYRRMNRTQFYTMKSFLQNVLLLTAFNVLLALFVGSLSFILFRKSLFLRGMTPMIIIASSLWLLYASYLINKSLISNNLYSMKKYTNLSVLFTGVAMGAFSSLFPVYVVMKSIVATISIFAITTLYGYLSDQDFSVLSSTIKTILISAIVLSLASMIFSLFMPYIAHVLHIGYCILGLIFNVFFISYLVNYMKPFYINASNNTQKIQLLTTYFSYILFERVIHIFQILLSLLRDNRKDK